MLKKNVKKMGMCPVCGSQLEIEMSDEDWLPCMTPEGFEWSLPAGKITDPAGRTWYIDAFGKRMTKDEYISKYKIDPEVALTNMRKTRQPVKIGRV